MKSTAASAVRSPVVRSPLKVMLRELPSSGLTLILVAMNCPAPHSESVAERIVWDPAVPL
ncbi:hypothetical protein D3C83_227080 [compost metagenome]